MPIFDTANRFERDYRKLTPEKRERFQVAAGRFEEDLDTGQFRPGLRVKVVQGAKTSEGEPIFEMTWAKPDGRATWQYGEKTKAGSAHIIWRRIGGHEIFDPGPS
ncbi:hypothetical protein ACFXAY_35085 [Streptomyces microflavus]|uniref:hypothetical protein n=1 Tax=Streptomyces microflavus TaxID=1919 RepID=UPI0036783140